MKHSNISIFIPHIGCPHMCSFCNQHTISGEQKAPEPAEVHEICRKALEASKSPADTEIAFFGGSFTAIPENYMTELLESVQDFIGTGKFKGIRISTRPDCIDRRILEILRNYGITSIELGAQSMKNHVLMANERGHSAEDVYKASGLIREYGFELGLQMMIGLYKSSRNDELDTVDEIISIKPDTVRIYPVVILKGTKLAELYESGEYVPFSFDDAAELAADALLRFTKSGIRVIKCGLHASEFVEHDMIGGFYHPAFREICESLIYRRRIEEFTAHNEPKNNIYKIAVNPSCISKAIGQNKSNIEYFKSMNVKIKFAEDSEIPVYEIKVVN